MSMTAIEKKLRPTNLDIQEQVAEVHECVHKVGEQVTALTKTVTTDRNASKSRDQVIEGRLSMTDSRLARLEASMDLMIKFFRLDREGSDPTPGVGSLKWWQAAIGIIGSVLGALGAWKYLWPALEAGFLALHHAILAH